MYVSIVVCKSHIKGILEYSGEFRKSFFPLNGGYLANNIEIHVFRATDKLFSRDLPIS